MLKRAVEWRIHTFRESGDSVESDVVIPECLSNGEYVNGWFAFALSGERKKISC